MTDQPAAFSAEYSDWKLIRGRKVVQIVFEVPIEGAGQVHDVLGGMPDASKSVWCAIARLKPESEVMPDSPLSGPNKTPPNPVADNAPGWAKKYAQEAGRLCNDPVFQKFLTEQHGGSPAVLTADEAAGFVRNYCGIKSRSEIVPGTEGFEIWNRLTADFEFWKRT